MKKKILVVDDEPRIRGIYTQLLDAEGFCVIEAKNGLEANDILKKESVDLVLLDLRMPEVNGSILYDVIQAFHKKTKVIISSVCHLETQRKIIGDAADYHDKSQGIEVLLTKIRQRLSDELLPGGFVH